MKTIRRWLALPFELLAVLKSIDARLAKIEACVNADNHQRRPALCTSHWNDNRECRHGGW